MTQILKDSIKIEYKLDQVTPISKYEMNAYNVPFAGNTSMCREVFVKGERKLEFSIDGDMSLSQIMQKPVFRDELAGVRVCSHNQHSFLVVLILQLYCI